MTDAPMLPGGLRHNRRLGQWLKLDADGVEMRSGKVEIGQGILTALAQIVAQTLEIPFDSVRPIAADTARSPNEAVTSGSLSVQDSGSALRQVCTEARGIYLEAAAVRLGVAVEHLTLRDGEMSAPDGRRTSYWELADDALLDRDATGMPAARPQTGAPAARVDLPDKIFGRSRFIHDLMLPGMLHGRMLRPPTQASRLVSLDDSAIRVHPGVVAVLRSGSLLGVVAETERQAEAAMAALRDAAIWDHPTPDLPDQDALPAWLRAATADSKVVAEHGGAGPNVPVARTLTASFGRPYVSHASIGPSCALACRSGARLEVWTHTQGIYNLRADLALALHMQPDAITVRHVEGAGCYGHNPADDVAFDAAWLAGATPGRAVRVQWSRADELGWAPFGPAMAVELQAELDADGRIARWHHEIWSNGHSTRPGRAAVPALLGAWHMDPPFERQTAINPPQAAGGGAERNAIPSYDFPAWRVTVNRVLAMPLRASALRGLGATTNVFAVEQFMDELAAAAGADPVAFRLAHTVDPRARAVIERAVAESNWHALRIEGVGRGLAYARYKNTSAYCAVVAEIRAEAEIRVVRLTIAADVGLVVSADGAANQLEGGAVQATSWTLKEAVRFDGERVISDSWDDYPILRFSEVPAVDVHIIDSTAASLGAGECSVGPTAAAIGNAVFDALGVRVREMPITAARIVAAMEADG